MGRSVVSKRKNLAGIDKRQLVDYPDSPPSKHRRGCPDSDVLADMAPG